ncbi:MAG: hypothetical protein ACM3P1_11825, partial [Candidatus Saccharibacteria bacterium]
MSNPQIRLVKNNQIDYNRWDACVAGSKNPLIYVQSWYLDSIFPDWDALVYGDYEFVMPLTIRHKLGLSFLLQPIFAQQQGIFPEAPLDVQNRFLTLIQEKFKYIVLHLHAGHLEPFPEGFNMHTRKNCILHLSAPYEALKARYSKHTNRQIKKATDNKVFIVKGIPAKEYMDLKFSLGIDKPSQPVMQTLNRLIEYGTAQGNGIIYAAYTQENVLCSAAYFLFTQKRVTYLNAVSNSEGKKVNAMHL